MTTLPPCQLTVRSFVDTDADGVSQLFRTVYGDCYVYPDVYLPSMIRRNNASHLWHSAVAEFGQQIVGHAVLWCDATAPDHAEFALNVVHPAARGHGIATQLAQYLCEHARQAGLSMLTIKEVSSHSQSQRLASKLGFQTTALMMDYVDSPFGNKYRESIVLGCLPIKPHPIPDVAWPAAWQSWLAPMIRQFGSGPAPVLEEVVPPLAITNTDHRCDVMLHKMCPTLVHEIACLPADWLIYLQLALSAQTPPMMLQLQQAGFSCAGLVPGPAQRWHALMIRGHHAHELDLRCPTARALLESEQAGARETALC
ncbi:GNAT superfamily N-acetyltransferase [Chitinivorax tropicus]|uniref:GNAT superfamily N-acetyltransferase n=1 Tax=Chitinivorax tropicus TaxID=714531 RepID=A0A840MH40_9PROT|nr:GNAT family N-acetyltransferase [Chitinivorax tropicus]MBB5016845.1 GNAT superfamily N-acetyltransferase [Chitinivorax tropicus]